MPFTYVLRTLYYGFNGDGMDVSTYDRPVEAPIHRGRIAAVNCHTNVSSTYVLGRELGDVHADGQENTPTKSPKRRQSLQSAPSINEPLLSAPHESTHLLASTTWRDLEVRWNHTQQTRGLADAAILQEVCVHMVAVSCDSDCIRSNKPAFVV